MNILCFGGGTDSTAILCGWVEKGYQAIDPIDFILFADTGGERPWTYEHIDRMQMWLDMNGMPPITVVRAKETLEDNLRRLKNLPPIVFGYKTCSQRFKIAPQDKFLNSHPQVVAARKRGETITKFIGYEFSESERWMNANIFDGKFNLEFPLVQWGWSRAECVDAIKRHGLPQPGKSSCFFCPNSKKAEIDELKKVYPDLYERAVDLEALALSSGKIKSAKVKGLGRKFSWREYAGAVDEALPMCMHCVDG